MLVKESEDNTNSSRSNSNEKMVVCFCDLDAVKSHDGLLYTWGAWFIELAGKELI